MTDPLSPEKLAQVPEVRRLGDELDTLLGAVGTRLPTGSALLAKATQLRDRYIAAIRDAVLSAERQRLLGMTPEEVVKEAAVVVYDILAKANQAFGERPQPLVECNAAVRAALPILLAPEAARREAVEKSARKAWECEVSLKEKHHALRKMLEAAEAERDRLKAALGAFVAQCDAMDKKTPGSGYFFPREAVAPLRAALSGGDTG